MVGTACNCSGIVKSDGILEATEGIGEEVGGTTREELMPAVLSGWTGCVASGCEASFGTIAAGACSGFALSLW